MGFSLMRSRPEYPLQSFVELPKLEDPWVFGKPLQSPPVGTLEYRLAPDHKGPPYPMYELPQPLMHRPLLEKLAAAGVDNFETFDAVLHHPEAGTLRDEYVAFNVVGLVATSVFAAQVMKNYVELEFETDEIDGITPDVAMIPESILLARFADRMGRIIVNDKVRQKIDPGPESGLVFFELD